MGLESTFDLIFRELTERTCKEWGYPSPNDQFYKECFSRLPEGLRQTISYGFSKKFILDAGLSKTKSAAFRPNNIPETKGPYSWFSKDNASKRPCPNWEYFIQIAEFIRLHEALRSKGYELRFEDSDMDIGIYQHGTLKVCCEIKEKSSKAQELIRGIKQFENADKLPAKDRGNDSLRKAKYISKLRPEYFYLVAIGRRFEFRVEYPEKMQFMLVEDIIPFI